MEWIDDALSAGVIPDELPDEVPPAANTAEANRLLRRLRSAQRARDDVSDIAAHEYAVIKQWAADEYAKLDRVIDYITRSLEGWMRSEHELTGIQSKHLPYGDVELRARLASIVVEDEDKAVEWLREREVVEAFARTKITIDKTKTKNSGAFGEIVATFPDEGMQERELVFVCVDPVTGEVVEQTIPGVRLRERLPDHRGLRFQVRPRLSELPEDVPSQPGETEGEAL
jgi:phage host-nuclease inhibitor protein Gam